MSEIYIYGYKPCKPSQVWAGLQVFHVATDKQEAVNTWMQLLKGGKQCCIISEENFENLTRCPEWWTKELREAVNAFKSTLK